MHLPTHLAVEQARIAEIEVRGVTGLAEHGAEGKVEKSLSWKAKWVTGNVNLKYVEFVDWGLPHVQDQG